jgi:hypothetical protein
MRHAPTLAGPSHRSRHAWPCWLLAVAAASGCAGPPGSYVGATTHDVPAFLQDRFADATFQTWTVRATGNVVFTSSGGASSGSQTFPMTYYFKAFERDKKLSVCAGYTAPEAGQRGLSAFMNAHSARDSFFILDDGKWDGTPPKIWPGFFRANRAARTEDTTTACVVTKFDWRPSLETAKPSVSLGRIY